MAPSTLETVVSLARRRGLILPAAEIYSGHRLGWDLGPLGVVMSENVKRQWWRSLTQLRDDVVALDGRIGLPRAALRGAEVRITRCRLCDHEADLDALLRTFATRRGLDGVDVVDLPVVPCPACGARDVWTEPHEASRLADMRPGTDAPDQGLRPDLGTGALIAFPSVMTSARKKPPFGIAQSGRCFRTVADPVTSALQPREVDLLSLTWFVPPGESASAREDWVAERLSWYEGLGLPVDRLRTEEGEHPDASVLLQFRQEDDWVTLETVSDRRDLDLLAHAERSGHPLEFFDQSAGVRYVPHVVECAAELDAILLALLVVAHAEDEAPNSKGGTDPRDVLRLAPALAPVKVAVLPLSRGPELTPRARELAAALRQRWRVDFDDAGAIGRRYRRQDEIGTPWCVTVDFDSLQDHAVTVRERDTMAQERVPLDRLSAHLAERLTGC